MDQHELCCEREERAVSLGEPLEICLKGLPELKVEHGEGNRRGDG